jgi:hypothetical protein
MVMVAKKQCSQGFEKPLRRYTGKDLLTRIPETDENAEEAT